MGSWASASLLQVETLWASFLSIGCSWCPFLRLSPDHWLIFNAPLQIGMIFLWLLWFVVLLPLTAPSHIHGSSLSVLKCSFPGLVLWLFSHTIHCFLQIHKLPALSFHRYLPVLYLHGWGIFRPTNTQVQNETTFYPAQSWKPTHVISPMFHLVPLSETMQLFLTAHHSTPYLIHLVPLPIRFPPDHSWNQHFLLHPQSRQHLLQKI